MANYKIELSRSAEKTLKALPKADLKKVVNALEMLAITPFPKGCRKLSGYASLFRVRIGLYRIIYEIEEQIITIKILKIGHRKDVYRHL